jgi:DNA recombination protein RmuC
MGQIYQTLPWLIALFILCLVLVYFIRRAATLQREMTARSSTMELATQEQVAAKERLLAHETELDRQRGDWEKQMSTLADEKGQERERYERLSKEHAQLQADLATEQTKALRLDELTKERDSARAQLDTLRNEKSVVDASLAGLQSQMEEEHKATEERTRLHTKAETTEREAAQAKIEELTTERNSARSQLDTLRNEKSAVDASLAALQSQIEEEHKATEERTRLHAKADTTAREAAQIKIDELTTERDNARAQLEALRVEKSTLDSDYATMLSKLDEERKSAREKIELLEQAEVRLAKEFENLANRIFEEKHQKFNEVSKTGVEALLTPMREQMSDFRKKVEDVYDTENKERASLRTEIQSLKTLNERISADALNLTKALKGDSKARGTWGEIQLERLLEESGLAKGREYDVQTSHRNEDGQRFKPDIVVHLPEKKDVVIDSKVSLVYYEQYYTAESDDDRQRHLRAHIASLRAHFNELSAKNYDELIGVNSLDLVIMFVPIEPALLLAFEHESNLFSEAFARRILLVSPSTLMATLQIIHNIWRYEYQNRNAQTIANEAGKLHDQFVNFVDALEKVGDQIKKAGESYDTAHKRLSSGKGNLVSRTLKLKVLGAKAKKSINNGLLETAMENYDTLALLPDETPLAEEIEEEQGMRSLQEDNMESAE